MTTVSKVLYLALGTVSKVLYLAPGTVSVPERTNKRTFVGRRYYLQMFE